MNETANKLVLVVFTVLIIPQITLAAWWNPFSWFDNWSFSEPRQAVTEEKIVPAIQPAFAKPITTQSVQQKVLPTPASSPIISTQPKPVVVHQPVIPIVKPILPVQLPKDFRAECNLSRKTIGIGQTVTAEIYVFFERSSDYEITWDEKYLTRKINNNEALYTIGSVGEKTLSATVKRKTDGYSKKVACSVLVECNEFICMSKEEQSRELKRRILGDIIDEIESWYDGKYEYLGPVQRCETSESIIRAHMYEYTSIGGVNIPEFDENVDCQNSVGPKAYQYKIDLLRDSI